MRWRIFLNFRYLYFLINYYNLPNFKMLKVLQALNRPMFCNNAVFQKKIDCSQIDFLINGGSLNFFLTSTTNFLQADFSLSVGLRKVYKGFDTRLIKLKSSETGHLFLYTNLISKKFILSQDMFYTVSASINNVKYKIKRWKYLYSHASFFFFKWFQHCSTLLSVSKHRTWFNQTSNFNLRLNKSEDTTPIISLIKDLQLAEHLWFDTVSRKPIGDEIHEIFYNSLPTFFVTLQLVLKYNYTLSLFLNFWNTIFHCADSFTDTLYDGFESEFNFNLIENSVLRDCTSTSVSLVNKCPRGLTVYYKNQCLTDFQFFYLDTQFKYCGDNRLNGLIIKNFFKLNDFNMQLILKLFFNTPDIQSFFHLLVFQVSVNSGLCYLLNSVKFTFFSTSKLRVLQKVEFFSKNLFYTVAPRSSVQKVNSVKSHINLFSLMYNTKLSILSINFTTLAITLFLFY